jgi:Fe-S oxidoreductase
LKGPAEEIPAVLNDKITDDVIWACTSCRACENACPVFIEQTDKIYEIRRNMVQMQGRFPPELQAVFKSMETNFSPWAMSPDDRDKWAEGLHVKTMAQCAASGEKVDYLFWVGCAGSYDDRNKKVSRALVSIFRKAGIKFAILGKEEKCTGDPARRMGNEYLAQTLIKENVSLLNNYGVTKVVTACPHCFNAIKNDWKDFGGNYEVIHHTQLINDLIQKGALKPSKNLKEKITYHDSCYLGRWNNEYAAPRAIVNSVSTGSIQEMTNHSDDGLCCGAGGGRMWMEEKIGIQVNMKRTEQALATGANIIAANCPFCMTMLTDGVKAKEVDSKVRVVDIAELVNDAT